MFCDAFGGASVAIVERNGHFYAVVRIDGKRRWLAAGTNRAKAKCLHDEWVVKSRKDELVIPKAITFAEFSKIWLNDYCAIRLKPVTIKEYGGYLDKYLIPEFGHMKMAQVRSIHVQRHVSKLVQEGRLKPKSIKNQLVPLKRMFAVAIQWGYATRNPAEHIALPRIQHEEMPFLTPQQMRVLIEATDPKWKALIACACLCGLRKGECLGLTWDSVLFDEHKLNIRQSLWNGALQTPKTKKSIAKVPMPPSLEALLMERMVISPASEMNLVFCRDDGSPLRPEFVNNSILAPALKSAGLPRCTPHSLRHGFVCALIAENLPLKVIQDMARHSSIQTTLDRYGHLLPNAKEDAAMRLERAVWGEVGA